MASQARGLQLLDKIENHDIEGVKQILSRDTDLKVDRKGDTPIHLAARKGYFDIIEILIKKGCNVNQKNQNGFAALHYAARDGRMDIVNFLLKSGADPNIKNKDGDAPIHELVKYQPMDTIEEMITLGMNVNLQNKLGRTPLHIAVANGRFDAVETLLTCGARSDIKDKNGRTPADSCKDPQLVKMMNLHSLTMEAMKKGIIMAQGISVSKKNVKNRINLARVGVVLETISMTTDITASFYCRREKSENSSCSISTEKGDEMVSDVFFIKITNVPRICDVTLTLPIYGLPTEQEELFARFDSGTTLPVLRVQKTGGEKTCTFDTKLTPDTFSIFALFTRAKTDVKNVGQEGGVITTDAGEGMRLEIPPDTFTKEANISLKVFPTENETTETDVTMLTDVYNITSDVSDNQNSMKLRLPMHNCVNLDAADDMLLITADDITDDSDENCLQVIDTKPTVGNMSIEYEIPHFSIHVVVSQMQFKENKKSIFDRLVSATERQRTAVFFAVVRHENNKMCPMISVECCLAKQAPKRIEKWVSKGYVTQDLEQSGSFLFKPYQEFLVYLDGVKTEDSTGKRKLAFLPRRPSFQPYRIQLETNTESFVEGSVMIHKCFNDDKDVSQDNEVVTALPFFIKLKEENANSEMDEKKKPKAWILPDYLNE
ncbi:uncharacterized protein LOC132751156 isoform X2 [Ruditapes philippinarum]|uniref:uncharacterized protein LOC132751156 isoform X2 n=1 Tax=Ruditapes philippinarum TaxID=129788 RepID=UPI00295B2DED|nr:uncharacterized protein LOC132751156 isoform X2 [Ruditapes philippinarum]